MPSLRIAQCLRRFANVARLGIILQAASVAAADPPTNAGFSVRTWDPENGLPHERITALARTDDGYLWIATEAGLARFDGARFVVMTTNQLPGLATNWISGISVENRSGALWVVDQSGRLTVRRHGAFEAGSERFPIGTQRASIFTVCSDGVLWLATEGKGIHRILPPDPAPAGNPRPSTTNWLETTASSLIADVHNRVWTIAGEQVMTYESGRWNTQSVVSQTNLPATAIANGRDGGVWIATVSGYPIYNRGGRVFLLKDRQTVRELAPYPWAQDSHRTRITCLCEDRQGRVWVGTYGGGVFYWQEQRGWQRLADEGSLAQTIITAMIEDDEGSLWIASQGNELYRVTERKVSSLSLPRVARENFILGACASRDGAVWVGTDGAGVFRYNRGIFEQVTNGLTSLQVGVLFEDHRGTLWAGTWGGLHQWQGERFVNVADSGPLQRVVLAITEDRKGNLWICTDGGLVRRCGDKTQVFGTDEGISHFYMRGVVEDAAGRICVASMDRGLFRQNGDRFEEIAAGKWSGANHIRALHADSDGSLWIATYGDGLFRLKDDQFKQWTLRDGLPDANLHTVLEDARGNLWMSSDNGIFGCPKQALESHQPGRDAPLPCWHLTAADGMETKTCSGAGEPVAAGTSDGRLWFPNQRSLAVFNPRGIPSDAQMWPALIEEVLVDGVLHPRDSSGALAVSSSARRLEFHYTSPNLNSAERLRFRHRIAGLEDDWIEDGDRRVVFFNRPNPGHYKFEVMAGGPDGQWHEPPGSLVLEIIPQWWERRAVQTVFAAVVLGAMGAGIWMAARARLRRKLQRLEMQHALEQERRRIARDLHDDVGSGLTEVILLTEPSEHESSDFATIKHQLELAAGKSRQLIGAMKQVVWTVNPENDSLPNLVDYLATYFQEFLEKTHVNCRLDVMAGLPTHRVSAKARHEILLAFKEALNNAVRHSNATEVWFRVRLDNEAVDLIVEDNGVGFDATQKAASGNGLSNMRGRMISITGGLTISSAPGKGTSITLRLPLERHG